MKIAALVLLALAVAAQLYVRLAPLPRPSAAPQASGAGPGEWSGSNWYEVALEADDPLATLAELDSAIRATARTEVLSGSAAEGHAAYVTRSLLWGFPDISELWIADGLVHLKGHSIYGKGDIGVNRARLQGWLATLGD